MGGLQTELSTELEGKAKCAVKMHSGLVDWCCAPYQVLLFEKGISTLKPAVSD